MFKTTDLILKLLHKKLSKNGLIVFDEALLGKGGEGKAAKLFFSKHKSNFTKLVLKKNYQPDLVFKKIIVIIKDMNNNFSKQKFNNILDKLNIKKGDTVLVSSNILNFILKEKNFRPERLIDYLKKKKNYQ